MTKLTKVNPTAHMIREVRLALPSLNLLIDDSQTAPFWLDDRTEPPPANLVACSNGLLDIGTGHLHPSTPLFFCTHALPFDFDPDVGPPAEWLKFLSQLWPDDPASIDTLREWFAYVLSADTRQHKAMLLVGPKRAGKGVIGRVLTGLLGAENVAGPPLAALASSFGLQSFLGKPLAIISDARLSGRTDQAVVVERILRVTGEDLVDVDRKFKAPITTKLPTRIMLLTNELPRLADSSGALAGRFIVLILRESWYGREDHGLTDRLLGELPAILTWALGGWETLQTRGHFLQPESSADAIQELEDLGSPVGTFVKESCVLEPQSTVECSQLFEAWRTWCTDNGRDHPGTVQTFGRDLRAVHPHIGRSQPRDGVGGRLRLYEGIGLD